MFFSFLPNYFLAFSSFPTSTSIQIMAWSRANVKWRSIFLTFSLQDRVLPIHLKLSRGNMYISILISNALKIFAPDWLVAILKKAQMPKSPLAYSVWRGLKIICNRCTLYCTAWNFSTYCDAKVCLSMCTFCMFDCIKAFTFWTVPMHTSFLFKD